MSPLRNQPRRAARSVQPATGQTNAGQSSVCAAYTGQTPSTNRVTRARSARAVPPSQARFRVCPQAPSSTSTDSAGPEDSPGQSILGSANSDHRVWKRTGYGAPKHPARAFYSHPNISSDSDYSLGNTSVLGKRSRVPGIHEDADAPSEAAGNTEDDAAPPAHKRGRVTGPRSPTRTPLGPLSRASPNSGQTGRQLSPRRSSKTRSVRSTHMSPTGTPGLTQTTAPTSAPGESCPLDLVLVPNTPPAPGPNAPVPLVGHHDSQMRPNMAFNNIMASGPGLSATEDIPPLCIGESAAPPSPQANLGHNPLAATVASLDRPIDAGISSHTCQPIHDGSRGTTGSYSVPN